LVSIATFLWSESISLQKNRTSLAIATFAAIWVMIVIVLIWNCALQGDPVLLIVGIAH
jgi:hypothetical protein